MKRLTLLTMLFAALAFIPACGDNGESPTPDNDGQEQPEKPDTPEKPEEPEEPEEPVLPGTDGKILIAYFTMPERDGVDASSGASRLADDAGVIGHVEFLAQVIRRATGGDLFEIRTVQTYPASHAPLIAQASDEKAANARPELAAEIDNFEQYDVIFVGYPIWWTDMPMPLYTFFDRYDFAGKTIVPFTSHGGSGLAGTPGRIARLEPGATLGDAFTVSRTVVGDAENSVLTWLRELGFTE